MGQKVNPVGFRTGIMTGWKSRWYASKKEFGELLVEDQKIRRFIRTQKDGDSRRLYPAIAKVEIERTRDEVRVILHSARPGVLVGGSGGGGRGRGGRSGDAGNAEANSSQAGGTRRVDELQVALQNLIGRRVSIQVEEVSRPAIVAQLVAEDIAERLGKRASFRRTMKQASDEAMEAGAKGIKIQLAGRLGGAEMSRREKSISGSIPLSTLQAKIDYGFAEAWIAQGHIGVQVWINQGTYSEGDDNGNDAQTSQTPKNPKRSYKR